MVITNIGISDQGFITCGHIKMFIFSTFALMLSIKAKSNE